MTTEQKATHTPGPWELCAHMAGTDTDCPCGHYGHIGAGDVVIALFGTCHRPGEDEGCGCAMQPLIHDLRERQANARAIGAVPELLAACEAWGAFHDPDHGDRHCIECAAVGDPNPDEPMAHEDGCRLGAAIAKARGWQ